MNPDQLENFFKEAKNITLEAKKKDSINEEILLFMKHNPLKEKRGMFYGIYGWHIFKLKTTKVTFASVMIFLLLGGIASVNAESALPGDILYPIKLGFNEKMMAVLAFSDERKTNVNILLVERRLEETEKLVIKNKMDSASGKKLRVAFKAESDKVKKTIHDLRSKKDYNSAIEVASNFESSLRAHGRILKSLEKVETKNNTDLILDEIDKRVKDVFDARTKMQKTVIDDDSSDILKIEASTQKGLESAENKISNVRKMIKKQKEKLGKKAVMQAENNLNYALQKIDKGKTNVELKSYIEAFSFFKEAESVAKETQNLIEARADLDVDVSIEINGKNSGDHK